CRGAGAISEERWRRRFLLRQLRHYFKIFHLVERRAPKAFGVYAGYPAWIRTKNNASKGRCVTVTPRGISISDCGFPIHSTSLRTSSWIDGRETVKSQSQNRNL